MILEFAGLEREAARFLLELARVTGVVAVSPIPWTNAPTRVRAGLIIVLGALVHGPGSLSGTAGDSQREMLEPAWAALCLLSEVGIGAAMGFVVRLTFASVEVMGSTVALPMGFAAAEAFDPSIGSSDSVLTRLLRQLALLVGLATGLHRVLIAALLSSFREFPVGKVIAPQAPFPLIVELTAHVLWAGARLALPLLAVLLIANLALGFVSRAAPSMQIFSIGFAVLLATGAAVLLFSLPDLAVEIARETDRASESLWRLLAALSARQ